MRTAHLKWIAVIVSMAAVIISMIALINSNAVSSAHAASHEDHENAAMWGFTLGRNMVSDETNLPDEWDPATGKNIKWTAELGSQSYAGPVLHGGKVFVGTNNESFKQPQLTGDRGNIMAFNEEDGKFLWQTTHTKLTAGRVNDWPYQGVCSAPYIEGDRVYYVSNRCEVVCVDTEGFYDSENDRPYIDETNVTMLHGDIVWKYDMIEQLDVFPHNLAVCSPIAVGNLLFIVTGNGVDEGHINIPSPLAPSFIALNKKTGALVWEDASPGMEILHGQWSNPAYGEAGGRGQVIFPGGDGWIYALAPETGELIWKFDCNPKDSVWDLGGGGTRNNIVSTPVIHEGVVYIGVGQDPEHGEGEGHLYAIDATKTGDITETGAIWHVHGDDEEASAKSGNPFVKKKKFYRTISTVSIHEGLVYAADLNGYVYCFDAKTGEKKWKHDMEAAVWGSTLVADGKVYIGDEDGDMAVLKAGPELEVLFEVNMGSSMYTTPVPKDGTLYLVSRNRLFAVEAAAE